MKVCTTYDEWPNKLFLFNEASNTWLSGDKFHMLLNCISRKTRLGRGENFFLFWGEGGRMTFLE
jgi:hypothetical protein